MKSLIVTTSEGLRQAIEPFKGMLDNKFREALYQLMELQEIKSVSFGSIDPGTVRWDGEMFVQFAKKPSARTIVNTIVVHARADELWMSNEKTLRLWWD